MGKRTKLKPRSITTNLTAASTKKQQPSKDAAIFSQIFNPTFIKFLLVATVVATLFALCTSLLKAWAAKNKEHMLSPGQFVEQHGITVLQVLGTLCVAVIVAKAVWRGISYLRTTTATTAEKKKKKKKKKRGPRLTFEHIEYKLYQGDRPWSCEEQEHFEHVLNAQGVPQKLEEWKVLAEDFEHRTSTDLQFRYKAVTKALKDAEEKRQQQRQQQQNKTNENEGNEYNIDENDDNDLQWWLEIGLKKYEKKVEQYVYDEAEDDYILAALEDEENRKDDEEERTRAEIELHPAPTGTTLSLEGSVLLWKIGTARIDECQLVIRCCRCDTSRDVTLSGTYADKQERALWCSKCKALMRVGVRPVLLHASNDVFCHVDTSETVEVVDVLPSTFLSSCEACFVEASFPNFQRGRRMEKNCTHCGIKLAMFAKQIVLNDLNDKRHGDSGYRKKKNTAGAAAKRPSTSSSSSSNVRLVVGENLPNMGKCKHFKKSLRWMRFPCCGKMYPCPHCHELAGECENAATQQATRMICGKCSLEQNITQGKCSGCAFHMGKGGRDTRQATMSKKDRKKKAPQSSSSKKTVSKKAQRVGLAGKLKREKTKVAKHGNQ